MQQKADELAVQGVSYIAAVGACALLYGQASENDTRPRVSAYLVRGVAEKRMQGHKGRSTRREE